MELDTKIKLLGEYLHNGGVQRINHKDLLQSLINMKFTAFGNVIPSTVDSLVRAYANTIVYEELLGPYLSETQVANYNTLLQKSVFFDCIKIDSMDTFNTYYNSFSQKNNFIFRGVNESKYRLQSSLQRNWLSESLYELGVKYSDFIENLIQHARENELIQETIGDKIDFDLAVLSLLQHYSCPTPLLDWTYSFQIALFFALFNSKSTIGSRKEIDSYFSIYYIEEENYDDGNFKKILQEAIDANLDLIRNSTLENLSMDKQAKENFNSYLTEEKLKKIAYKSYLPSAALRLSKLDKLMTLPVLYFSNSHTNSFFNIGIISSENIKAQNGAFTWSNDPVKPIEHMINIDNFERNNIVKNSHQLCYCLDIKKALIPEINEFLFNENINMDTVFPESENEDLTKVCKDIFENVVNTYNR